MRAQTRTLALLCLLASPLAAAQTETALLCKNDLQQDRQPNFNANDGTLELTNQTMVVTGETPPRLQLNTNLAVLNPERIIFPFTQRVTVSYVYESALASASLGYMYLDDLREKGYVDTNGELTDANANGILDLHEDIYNLAPESGTGARPYIGRLPRRCTPRTFTSGGLTYTQPEIGMKSDCADSFTGNSTDTTDARPGRTLDKIDSTDLVGAILKTDVVFGPETASATDYSDNGLFPHIPNLLEPAANANGNMGLGQMVFLLADDDGHQETYGNLGPVQDTDEWIPGIPDYDVSAYDPSGLQSASNPDVGISSYDRTVDLGEIEGGREIVFFIVTYYDSRQYPDPVLDSHVLPCLKQDLDGKCLLHFRAPIHVFFSKAMWNMDQNSSDNPVVAERNIGCGYDSDCNRTDPASTPDFSCPVVNNGPRLCGWLDGPKTEEGSTLHRLLTVPAYGNLDMPMERVIVPRPTGPLAYRNPMPHVIVGAPTTDPFRWILGFEDVPGGGDRDFNDLVFVINKQNGGGTRSATVSGDISPDIAEDFTITKVRFHRQDDFAPAPRFCGRTHCWTEETPGACSVNGAPEPTITYSLAVDCRLCANGICTRNPNPTWFPVEFPEDDPQNVELDILALGFTGSQLCWKVDVSSPNERCRPVIDNINVGYQAVRAGAYARASPATLGNALIYGVNETPGRAWGQNWPGSGMPAAGTRAYDERKDFSLRGRLYLRSLYDPETPETTRVIQRWDAGKTLADGFRTDALQPQDRKLYTLDASGQRTEVSAEAEPGDNNSLLFPDRLCDVGSGRRWRWDLNRDGKCGTPSITAEEKHVEGVDSDRHFFVQWLYGWEDRHAPGRENIKRPWPMGGINLSTVALAVPPYLDTWSQNALPGERDLYRKNFMDPLKERSTIGYVGTMNGFLHAFDSGEFRNIPRDQCAGGNQLRGLFKVQGTTCPNPAPRLYGTGAEKFAYLPRGMLERYRNLYVQYAGAPTPPSLDASPSIANVDFGIANQPAWSIKSDAASKTEGAKTVLVSATGKKSPYVFSLDITDPTKAWYPLPLWEFNMVDEDIDWMFFESWLENVFAGVRWPDNSGSRHAPSVARLAWGPNASNAVWAAVVGTDYKPNDQRAGALYLLDMKTGRPLNYGTTARGQAAGIITLDYGFGVAAESALVDLNRDGNYDVIYVPTTAGNVYRINLDQVDTSDYMGRKVKKCKVVNTKAVLDIHPNAEPSQDNNYQQIFSNLAVKVVRDGAEPVVRFYYGTSDNPDEFSDGPPNKDTYKYHLLAFEDRNPKGIGDCEQLNALWVHKLDAGQVVWGGVTLTGDKVFATTAVGQAADVCSLSDSASGRLYESGQVPNNGTPPAISSRSLGGHGVTAPVVHDQHLFVLTATGEMKLSGSGRWNNGTANTGATRTRVLIYDPNPEGGLPR